MAFIKGDLKTAYIIYTACSCLSLTNPVYSLNRAAVGLSSSSFFDENEFLVNRHVPELKLYECAVVDARCTIEKADAGYGDGVKGFNLAKAYFRRGQALFHLGHWDQAAKDYDEALELQPGDREIMRGIKELKKVRKTTCSCADKHHHADWISAQGKAHLKDVFGEELEALVEDWLLRSGTTSAECIRRAGRKD
ncbi:hypothetical protein B0H19DRAFT_1090122 [Mycena capillaripes]|nr:hypothetical protein B0H19DRAFT_1090122 [Mycena capillaripes]